VILTKNSEEKQAELKTENKMLDSQLAREKDDRQRVLDVLQEAVEATGKPKKRRGRFLALLAIAGVSYTLGAKAGRYRYEQIAARWHDFRAKIGQDIQVVLPQDSSDPKVFDQKTTSV
jgi:hypothetical protein